MGVLNLEHITFGFAKGKPLLKDLSLSLEEGKIYALMGGNGSGKTTLFNLITGFHKTKQGSVIFNSNDITNLPPHKINQLGIGRTFQDLRLISKLTVKENVLLSMKGNPTDSWHKALLPHSLYKKEIALLNAKASSLIAEYFLSDIENSMAGEISYGQQKLLNLACCVANEATLLLLDEPLAGINPEYRNRISSLLKKLKENGKTIFMIEHHTESIEQLADSIFFLSNGYIKDYNNYQQLKTDPLVLEAYL
ncbi:MAG: ATP-binding cassette domain-containing protein [Ferruginibacter sp.]